MSLVIRVEIASIESRHVGSKLGGWTDMNVTYASWWPWRTARENHNFTESSDFLLRRQSRRTTVTDEWNGLHSTDECDCRVQAIENVASTIRSFMNHEKKVSRGQFRLSRTACILKSCNAAIADRNFDDKLLLPKFQPSEIATDSSSTVGGLALSA